jgi:hypothetical protein
MPFTKRANGEWDEDHVGVKEGADDVATRNIIGE